MDLARVTDGIAELLGCALPAARDIEVADVARVFGGNARRAWGATVRWRDHDGDHSEPVILLVRQAGSQVRTDPAREYAVLAGLAERGVRAPRVWGHDPDGLLFGNPAILLQRLIGSADAVAYLNAKSELGRARTLDLARAAAELHAAPASAIELDTEETELGSWHRQFLMSRQEPHPALGWLFDWLADTHEAPARPVLVHGDYRPGNVLYDGPGIVGLLDWEMAHLGHPAEDLAWAYRELWSPERFVPLEEFVDAYTAAGGAQISSKSLLWHRVFCEVKFATISLLAARSFADGTSRNLRLIDRTTTVLPSVRRSLQWIGAAQKVGAPC